MVKKLIFCLAVFFLLVQVVSAVDTEIQIKTMPEHEVQVVVIDYASGMEALAHFKNTSDKYGDVFFTYSSHETIFNLRVFIKKDGERVISKKSTEGYAVGELVYFELAPAWFEFIATPVANVSESGNQTIGNSTIDGNEVSEEVSTS